MSQWYYMYKLSTGVVFVFSPSEPIAYDAGLYAVGLIEGDISPTFHPDMYHVYTPGGFTYKANPIVNSLSPNTGAAAGGADPIISGANFLGATAVTFGGAAPSSFNVVAAGIIEVLNVPAHAAGAVNVVVTTGFGSGTKVGGFTYT